MIRGHIWSCDRAGDGIERLKYIRDRYYFAGVNSVREVYGKNDSWIDFENGDRWRVVSAAESMRGARSHIAWIDSRVDENFLRCVIKPTLCCYPFGTAHYEFYNAKE